MCAACGGIVLKAAAFDFAADIVQLVIAEHRGAERANVIGEVAYSAHARRKFGLKGGIAGEYDDGMKPGCRFASKFDPSFAFKTELSRA